MSKNNNVGVENVVVTYSNGVYLVIMPNNSKTCDYLAENWDTIEKVRRKNAVLHFIFRRLPHFIVLLGFLVGVILAFVYPGSVLKIFCTCVSGAIWVEAVWFLFRSSLRLPPKPGDRRDFAERLSKRYVAIESPLRNYGFEYRLFNFLYDDTARKFAEMNIMSALDDDRVAEWVWVASKIEDLGGEYTFNVERNYKILEDLRKSMKNPFISEKKQKVKA